MASFTAAGFATYKPFASASASSRTAKIRLGLATQETELKQSCDRVLGGISMALCESVSAQQRLDLESLGRRADASRQLQHTIVALKDRIARRTAKLSALACGELSVELAYKAS